MSKAGMLAMRRRRKLAEMFRHLVSERLRLGLSLNDLIIHKDLPRSWADKIVIEASKEY